MTVTPKRHVVGRSLRQREVQQKQRVDLKRVKRMSKLEFLPEAQEEKGTEMLDAFRRDRHPSKMNLSIESYRGEDLEPYVLNVVREAEERLFMKDLDKEYVMPEGAQDFRMASASLLLGSESLAVKEGKILTAQTVGGTGALRLAGEFIQRTWPEKTVYLSDPTLDNHKAIFTDAGVQWKTYEYLNPSATGLDFEGMMADIEEAPDASVILLHGCAHNPTGIDPTRDQWGQIADLCIGKNHFAFFDVAYQGFATGSLEEDAYAPRLFVEKGLEILVAQSFSKNLGLGAERVGGLHFVVSNSNVLSRILGHLRRVHIGLHSVSPIHGARIVTEILTDPLLTAEWKTELQEMNGHLRCIRSALHDHLTSRTPDRNWSHILSQTGFFSSLSLSSAQAEMLRKKHSIYTPKNGCISLAGVSSSAAEYLAHAISDVLTTQAHEL